MTEHKTQIQSRIETDLNVLEKVDSNMAIRIASLIEQIDNIKKWSPTDFLETFAPLQGCLEKVVAYYALSGNSQVSPEDASIQIASYFDQDFIENNKDFLPRLSEFIVLFNKRDPRAIASLKRDVIIASKAISQITSINYLKNLENLRSEDLDKEKYKVNFIKILTLQLGIGLQISVLGAFTNSQFYFPPAPFFGFLTSVCFAWGQIGIDMFKVWKNRQKINTFYDERKADPVRTPPPRVLHQLKPQDIEVSKLDEVFGERIEDLMRMDSASKLAELILNGNGQSVLDFCSRYTGYLPEKFLDDQIKFLKKESPEISNIIQFADRCVELSDIFLSTEDSFNIQSRVEIALEKTGKIKNRWFGNIGYYTKAAENFSHNISGRSRELLAGNIQDYLRLKQEFLKSDKKDKQKIKLLIIENLRNIQQLKEKKRHGISRRTFLKGSVVTGAALFAGKFVSERPEVQQITQAMNSRDRLPETDKEVDIMLEFSQFWEEYHHPFLESISTVEGKDRTADMVNQAILYWDGKAENLQQHFKNFFDSLFDYGEKYKVSPRELFYFFRIASQNTWSRQAQNRDVDIGKKQIFLANAIQVARNTNTYHLTEELLDRAIVTQSGIYDAVRTAQDITIGIHDMEVSILAESLVAESSKIQISQDFLESGIKLNLIRENVQKIKERIQFEVFEILLSQINDQQAAAAELLSPEFLASLGIGDEISPIQICNYTKCWYIASKTLNEQITHEGLKQVSDSWKAEYRQLLTTDKEVLKKLFLDQGKGKQFWINLLGIKGFESHKEQIEKIISAFDDFELAVTELVSARDNFTSYLGPEEYNMEFQINLGVAVVKEYSDKVRTYLRSSSVFKHMQPYEIEDLSVYMMLNIREITSEEILVRAQNQFPQDRVEAMPYNHPMTYECMETIVSMCIQENILNSSFSWPELITLFSELKDKKVGSEKIKNYYQLYLVSNSHNRANDAMKAIMAYG